MSFFSHGFGPVRLGVGMGLMLMNERDLHRVGVLAEIRSGDRTIASGAALPGLTARHVRRLPERYARSGRCRAGVWCAGVLETGVTRWLRHSFRLKDI